MTSPSRISWLYTRGTESVYIYEVSPLQLAVCGPGAERSVRMFTTSQDLFQFNQRHTNGLSAAGYRFDGFGIERRSGTDRRRVSRSPNDRRYR